jgi:hypothetical protein
VEAATVFALRETLAVNKMSGVGNGRGSHADEFEAARQCCNWNGVSGGNGELRSRFLEKRRGDARRLEDKPTWALGEPGAAL